MCNFAIILSLAETTVLVDLLTELRQRFSNDICNDMEIEDTPENRVWVKDMNMYLHEEDDITVYNGKILLLNFEVVAYLSYKIKEQFQVFKERNST